MRTRILVTDIAWPDLEVEKRVLKEADATPVLAESTSQDALVRAAHGCRGIITCWAKVTPAVIDACDSCLVVSRCGIGIDNIDLAHCSRRGIPVSYVPDYCISEVADHSFALVLALLRKIVFYDRDAKQGKIDRSAGYPLRRLSGLTLGILGFGRIGQAVAQRARPFGFKIITHSKELPDNPEALEHVDVVSYEELLARSDVITLHLPLTPETEHILGADEFARMKPGVFIVNTARGGLVDPDALLAALDSGRVSGAGLDVTEPEPLPGGHPLLGHPGVIHTPHAAFLSRESLVELRERGAAAVVDVLRGKTPRDIANPEVLDK